MGPMYVLPKGERILPKTAMGAQRSQKGGFRRHRGHLGPPWAPAGMHRGTGRPHLGARGLPKRRFIFLETPFREHSVGPMYVFPKGERILPRNEKKQKKEELRTAGAS